MSEYFCLYVATSSSDRVVREAWGEHANWEDEGCWNMAWEAEETPQSFLNAWEQLQKDGWAEWTDEHGITWDAEMP